jgi:L-lactate dehydrogenase complex protein LldE
VNILKITDLGAKLDGVATFHDSCSGLREYGIHREPRVLLSKVRGLEVREMANTEVCCGFGGMFSTKYEGVAVGMAEQKLKMAEDVGAEIIISTDLSCLLHLDGLIKKQNKSMRVMHLVDALVQGWE